MVTKMPEGDTEVRINLYNIVQKQTIPQKHYLPTVYII